MERPPPDLSPAVRDGTFLKRDDVWAAGNHCEEQA